MNESELVVELSSLKSFLLQVQSKLIIQSDINTHYKEFIDDLDKRLKVLEDTDSEDTASDEGLREKDELSPTTLKVIGGSIEIGHEFTKSYS